MKKYALFLFAVALISAAVMHSCLEVVENKIISVTGVTLNKSSMSLIVGEKESLTATVAPAEATSKYVLWSSNAQEVASVNQSGEVTAVAVGTAVIKVITIDGNKTATCEVTVKAPFVAVTDITDVPATASAGTPLTLTGNVVPQAATNQNITWSVQNAGNTGATITGGNSLNTTGSGTVVVTATVVNGKSPTENFTKDFTITVNAASTFTITASPTTLNFGTVSTSYMQPAAQTVTVRNTGTGTITLNALPAVTNYTIGALSTTTLAPNATATFTVRPNARLAEGNYDRTITINGSNGVTASVQANFTVNAPVPTVTIATTSTTILEEEWYYLPFTINTTNIDVWEENHEVLWYTNAAGTNPNNSIPNVNTTITTGSASRTLQMDFGFSPGTYYFRVMIGGVLSSNVGTLTITPKTQVTFTATQTGGASGTANSTGIVLTFSTAVSGLTANHIDILNTTGAATKGTLTGSGTKWTISLTQVITQGEVNVYVSNFGLYNFTNSPLSVMVYKNLGVAPQITTQPTNQTVNAGSTATFTVVATGTPVPSYQWYNAGTGGIVSGANSATLTLTSVTAAMNGNRYYCQVSNTAGSVNSATVTLTVNTTPSITVTPTSASTPTFSLLGKSFMVETTNINISSPGEVRWYTSSAGTTTTTAPDYVSTSVSSGSANRTLSIYAGERGGIVAGFLYATPGTYYFRVIIDGVQSNVCTLYIYNVTVSPASQTINPGQSAPYTVTTSIAVTDAVTVQWYSDADGTQTTSTPTGVTTGFTGSGTTRTLTVNTTTSTNGMFYFRVSVGSVSSGVCVLSTLR